MKRTDLNGLKRSLLASALAFAIAAPAAMAQEAAPAVADEEETTLETVEVVGSRIKRSEIEGPSPVTVITAEQIEAEGFTTVYDALGTLTQTTGTIQNELFQNGFTPNAQVLNLRGLGPGRTLVLINGRRAADYPLPYNGQSNFVNLASVPAAAVERIEVLAGGASAIYGSDAIAGVINIVLKKNFEGQYLSYLTGHPTNGGSWTNDIQWVGGNTGDRWSLTYAVEYFERGAMYANERDFMDSYRDDPSVTPETATAVQGIRLRDRLIGTGANSQVWPDGQSLQSVCSRFSEFELDIRPTGTWCGYYGYPATQAIRNADENVSAYVYGNLDLTDNLQGFASINVWDSKAAAASSTQFWSVPLYYDLEFDSIMDGQRIFTPDELGGFGRQQTTYDERAIDVAVGLMGTLGDRFDWDATLSHSRYDTDSSQPRFLAQPLIDYFLGPRLGSVGPYGLYDLNEERYFSPITGEVYDSLSTHVLTDANSKSTNASFVLSGDLFEMPAGPLSFATVFEVGTQEYQLNADPRIAPGQAIIYNLTGTGGGGERDRYAIGTEVAIPLHDTFKATLAARYDKYDDVTDVDDAFTWNAGLEWRPMENLLVRGAYSTSFRAPDMHYIFAEQSGFFSGVFDEYTCRSSGQTVTQCGNTNATYNYTAFGVRSGNPALQEEEGKSYTFGLVWDIMDNLSFSADYYSIELEGVVGDISSAYILQNEADCRLGVDRQGNAVDGSSAFCQFILSSVVRTVGGPNDGRIEQVTRGPINRSFLSNEGIDASIRYQLDTDRMGEFAFQLAWSHVLDQKFAEFADEPRDSYRDDLTNFDFRSRMRGSVTWKYQDFTATVFGLRYGSLPNWEETGRIAPYMVYNMNLGYRFSENFSAQLIVNNVLDKGAPKDDSYFTYPFFWRAYSPIGREVFGQIEFRW